MNENLSWDDQKSLLMSTLHSPQVKKYPMNIDYCKSFLKKLIACLTKLGEDVHDELYKTYCELIQQNSDKLGTNFYKHYMVTHDGDHDFVIIKESPNLIVDGTTGLRTWEAAVVLADWAVTNKQHFTDKHILELGSGLGMSGTVISKLCAPASYTFSDCHPRVLSELEENVMLNFPDMTKYCLGNVVHFSSNHSSDLNILELDWTNEDATFPTIPDVIVGADIIYDDTIFLPLISVLKRATIINEKVEIFIISTIRNEKTAQEFIIQLGENNFKIEMINYENSVNIRWNDKQMYSIMKIYS